MNIISAPQEPWLGRLRRGHHICLYKQSEFAQVEWAWEPPEPGHVAGRIGIRRHVPGGSPRLETWYVNERGQGFDGLMLIMPVEGNLPDTAPEISEPLVRQIMRELSRLQARLARLEAASRSPYMPYLGLSPEDLERFRKFDGTTDEGAER